MRVGSFNLLSGRSPSDNLTTPDRLASAITALDVDVLGLQEVDRFQTRSGQDDQAELAAKAMRANEFRFSETICGKMESAGWTPGRAPDPAGLAPVGPGYGIALLSRLPVQSWHELQLPAPRLAYPTLVGGQSENRRLRFEKDRQPRPAWTGRRSLPSASTGLTRRSPTHRGS